MRLFGIKSALSIATALGLTAGAIVLARQAPAVDRPTPRPSAPEKIAKAPEKVDEQAGVAFVARKIESLVLRSHATTVFSAAFSPDGKAIVSASDDTVRLWDAATGGERAKLPGPRTYVYGLAVSPDGRSIATTTGDFDARDDLKEHRHNAGHVSIWDVDARVMRWSTAAHRDVAAGVAFSPDGRFLASSGQDDLIKIWDAATGEERAVLKGQETYVYDLAFSPDGKTLAAAGRAGAVGGARLWRVGGLLESLSAPPPR